jgi:hypothetical protein
MGDGGIHQVGYRLDPFRFEPLFILGRLLAHYSDAPKAQSDAHSRRVKLDRRAQPQAGEAHLRQLAESEVKGLGWLSGGDEADSLAGELGDANRRGSTPPARTPSQEAQRRLRRGR